MNTDPRLIQRPAKRRARLFCLAFLFLFTSLHCQAANWGRLLDAFTGTKSTKSGTGAAAEGAERLLRPSTPLSKAAGREARHLGVDPANRTLARRAVAKSMLEQGCEPALVRSVEGLADAELDAVLVLARGSRRVRETVPDLVSRTRLTNQGGIPAVSALGLSDSIPVDDFIKLDALANAGKVPATIGGKPTLARLGELLGNGVGGFPEFYGRYIRGRETKWVAGGALAWWLASPETFQDAAGNLTEAGFERLSELAGVVVASAIRGAAEGGKKAGEDIASAATEGLLTGKYAWAAWVSVLAFIYLAGLALPGTRRIFMLPIAPLFRKSS